MNTVAIEQDTVGEILYYIEEELGLKIVHVKTISKPNVRLSRRFLKLRSSDNQNFFLKLYTAQVDKAFSEGFERYEKIYRTIPDNLKANIAEPILNGQHREIFFSLEGYLDGQPLKPFLERRLVSFRRKETAISQCLTWLVGFKKTFPSLEIQKTDLLVKLKQYRELFDCSKEEIFLLELLEQRIDSGIHEHKYFIQHGDLSIENVLINKETFGILDWELTGGEAIPHHDFFVFLTTGMYGIENCFDKNRADGFRYIFSKNNNRNFFVESLRSYAKGLNLKSSFPHLFFPYYLVTLPVILKQRRSSSYTIATARKNAEMYAVRHEEIDNLLTL